MITVPSHTIYLTFYILIITFFPTGKKKPLVQQARIGIIKTVFAIIFFLCMFN